MKYLLLLLLLLITVPVQASDTWLDIHIVSKHSSNPYDFNENNSGIGLSKSINTNMGIGLGTYTNSFNKTSNYVGVDLHTTDSNMVSVGVTIGMVSGYDGTPMYPFGESTLPIPILLPSITINPTNYFRIMLGVTPPMTKNSSAVLTFSISFKL